MIEPDEEENCLLQNCLNYLVMFQKQIVAEGNLKKLVETDLMRSKRLKEMNCLISNPVEMTP